MADHGAPSLEAESEQGDSRYSGLCITDIRTSVVNLGFRNAVFVHVETDAGITGIAETVMKRRTLVIEKSIQRLRSYLIGKDPTLIEDHWEKMYRDSFWVGGPLHATAVSAIDCALWDILGKSLNVPVYKLHGGPTREKVLAYCHVKAGSTPEQFADNVVRCKERGYQAAKTTLPLFYGVDDGEMIGYSGTSGLFDRSWKETDYLPPDTFKRIREFFIAARELAGDKFGLAVDCHGRLNLKSAIQLCEALEDLNLSFIEEPVPPENSNVLCEVRRATSTRIAAGERWATIHGVREFVEKQAVDILQCDLVNCGGITGLKKIAAVAEAYYVPMAPHNPNGPLATAMNLHFAAIVPNYLMLETIGSEEDELLSTELMTPAIKRQDGFLEVPRGYGFGVELNEEAFASHPYSPREAGR